MVSKPRSTPSDAPEPGSADPSAPSESVVETPGAVPSERAASTGLSVVAEPCGNLPLSVRVEAVLLVADRPMPEARLVDVLGLSGDGSVAAVRAEIETLNAGYDKTGRAFRVERVAGGWQVLTRPELGPLLDRLHADRRQARLSPAAMETLAVIAYRQPIMRAEIEAIRGVACGEVLRGLLERRLVRITGRSDELGRPMLYGTTRQFLDVFGLATLDDLPDVEGLERRPAAPSVARSRRAAAAESAAGGEAPPDGDRGET